MSENRLVVHSWKPFVKNTLLGFACVELPSGLYIDNITVHRKGARSWTALPAIPWLENGQPKIVDGKPQYKNILRWRSKELADQFSAKLIEAVKTQHPGAL